MRSGSKSDGIDGSRLPERVLGLMGRPDKEVRELVLPHLRPDIAELQEASNGCFYGVGIIDWWDGDGAVARSRSSRPGPAHVWCR